MEASPEIHDLCIRTFELMAAQDIAAIMSEWSHQSGVRLIGIDPTEWFTDRADIERFVRAGSEGSTGIPTGLEIETFAEGSVGWANMRYALPLPHGGAVTVRWTHIFHLEGDAWKSVTAHVSAGVPEDQFMPLFDSPPSPPHEPGL
jgi:hypothetical protein